MNNNILIQAIENYANIGLQEPRVHLFHYRWRGFAQDNLGGATALVVEDWDKLFFSYALCCYKDNFSKKIGRNIAEGRMIKGDIVVVKKDLENSLYLQVIKQLGKPEISGRNFVVFQGLHDNLIY